MDPCYVFHPLNAWAEGTKVVCDVGRHATMWRESMEDFDPSYLHRWTFDLETGAVHEQPLDDVSHGFPRVDDRVIGLKHRYGWVVAERPGSDGTFNAPAVVARYDVEKGTSEVHDFGADAQPGEFVFVERDGAAAEDDGVAMGFVYHKETDTSDLVILDAANPSADPLATIHLPRRVPHGFHGSWIRG